KVANDNDKSNDAGLEGIDKEIAERSSNRELASAIASLKNLKTQGVLNEASELLLKALERERDGRLQWAECTLDPYRVGLPNNTGDNVANDASGITLADELKAIGIMLQLGNGKIDFIDGGWFLTKPQDPEGSTATLDITGLIKHMTTSSGLEYSVKNAVNWIYNNIFSNLPPSPFSFSIGENIVSFVTGNPKDAREYVDMEGLIKEQAKKYSAEGLLKDIGMVEMAEYVPGISGKHVLEAQQALDQAIEKYINMFGDHRTIIAPNYLKFEFKLEYVNYEWKAYIRPTEKVPIYIVK
ncbi:MAG: hypothetical protein AB1297_05160, partial [bacterium]